MAILQQKYRPDPARRSVHSSSERSSLHDSLAVTDNRTQAATQALLQHTADHSPLLQQMRAFQLLANQPLVKPALHQQSVDATVNPVFQFGKDKQAREAEVKRLLKQGRAQLGSLIGVMRPYLNGDEQNLIFLSGLIGGGFNFSSLAVFLGVINAVETNQRNQPLQSDLAAAFNKVIGFKEDFTAIVGESRNEFRTGRIAEFLGLSGELSAAVQLIKAGKSVSRLGANFSYGDKQSQEVDLVATSEHQAYYVEVAATPSKLRDKIDGGLKGTYPQMQGYKDLAQQHTDHKVAYSCPTLAISNISAELIDKVAEANIQLVINGEFYDGAGLQKLVDDYAQTVKTGRKKTTKSHKQTQRDDRAARLRDRGRQPNAKDLLNDALDDYRHQSYSADEDFEDYA